MSTYTFTEISKSSIEITQGIHVIPPESDKFAGISADFSNFVKYVRQNHPSIDINLPNNPKNQGLYSSDIIFPLLVVCNEIPINLTLSIISDYIIESCRGLRFRNNKPTINLSLRYEDKKNKITREFTFSGSGEDLQKIAKKFDPNNIFNDPQS